MPYTVQIAAAATAEVQCDPASVQGLVQQRLGEIGVDVIADNLSISAAQVRAEHRILCFINQRVFPDGLLLALVDEISADIIAATTGKLEQDANTGVISSGTASEVTEIREGDVSYRFGSSSSSNSVAGGAASGTPEAAIAMLREARETWWHYRSIAW